MKNNFNHIKTLLYMTTILLCIAMFFLLQHKIDNTTQSQEINNNNIAKKAEEKHETNEHSNLFDEHDSIDYHVDITDKNNDKYTIPETTLRLPPKTETTIPVIEENKNLNEDIHPEKIVVNQGDVIYNVSPLETIGENMKIETVQSLQCTVGFVQKPENVLWTSSHCFKDGDIVYDKLFNRIGIADRYYDGDIFKNHDNPDIHFLMSNDFTIVRLDDNVVGNNIFSGDFITPSDSIVSGENVCSFSRMENKTFCGNIIEKYNMSEGYDSIVWSNLPIKKGDSGGPVWIEGKGILGVQSGYLTPENGDNIGVIKLPYDNVSTKTYIHTQPQYVN